MLVRKYKKSFVASQSTLSVDLVPNWLILPVLLALCFLILPLLAIANRVEWTQILTLAFSEAGADAFWISLKTSFISLLICTIFGVPLAFYITKNQHRLVSRILSILISLPMVLPPVVAGLLLLITWGRTGILGKYLELFGYSISFTTVAVVFAQVFVSLPFLVTSFAGALNTRGFAFEMAARSLGASKTRTLFTITLPLVAPALISAMALCFARSLGEFGATIVFAGSLQGKTRTLPLEIYLQRENDTSFALALSVVIVGIALLVIGGATLVSSIWYRRLLNGRKTQFNNKDTNLLLFDLEKVNKSKPGFTKSEQTVDVFSANLIKESAIHQQEFLACPSSLGKNSINTSPVGITAKIVVPERDVELELEFSGEKTIALLGLNGAGKSTVIQVLTGEITSKNIELKWLVNNKPQNKVKIAYLAQKPLLFPHLTVIQNLLFALKCQGVSGVEAEKRALAELEIVQMRDYADKKATQLSGGQAQKVAIARALVTNPEVFLLDEPCAALDMETAKQIRQLIKLRCQGVTTVIVTHQLDDLVVFKPQCVFLRAGRIYKYESWKTVLKSRDQLINSLIDQEILSKLNNT